MRNTKNVVVWVLGSGNLARKGRKAGMETNNISLKSVSRTTLCPITTPKGVYHSTEGVSEFSIKSLNPSDVNACLILAPPKALATLPDIGTVPHEHGRITPAPASRSMRPPTVHRHTNSAHLRPTPSPPATHIIHELVVPPHSRSPAAGDPLTQDLSSPTHDPAAAPTPHPQARHTRRILGDGMDTGNGDGVDVDSGDEITQLRRLVLIGRDEVRLGKRVRSRWIRPLVGGFPVDGTSVHYPDVNRADGALVEIVPKSLSTTTSNSAVTTRYPILVTTSTGTPSMAMTTPGYLPFTCHAFGIFTVQSSLYLSVELSLGVAASSSLVIVIPSTLSTWVVSAANHI
ncbi:hypothetical protein BV22DRAFT_1050905 [Leucogyrophana mollusca]|uniref:Uncharacterized protein n=1 Tax=Leucogyrophana mollusca TaxID=85980 RepID=A0ACB8B3D0_9AGAM|nr:hypothetical protein BV22DRAFT_1050905 [Leucogyrophana mollusca]